MAPWPPDLSTSWNSAMDFGISAQMCALLQSALEPCKQLELHDLMNGP
jgi:hypothetical protein